MIHQDPDGVIHTASGSSEMLPEEVLVNALVPHGEVKGHLLIGNPQSADNEDLLQWVLFINLRLEIPLHFHFSFHGEVSMPHYLPHLKRSEGRGRKPKVLA